MAISRCPTRSMLRPSEPRSQTLRICIKKEEGSIPGTGESSRNGPDGGELMNYSDDNNGTDPKQTPNPRPDPDPAESNGPTGWLDALNSFLERAFLKADVDTGC